MPEILRQYSPVIDDIGNVIVVRAFDLLVAFEPGNPRHEWSSAIVQPRELGNENGVFLARRLQNFVLVTKMLPVFHQLRSIVLDLTFIVYVSKRWQFASRLYFVLWQVVKPVFRSRIEGLPDSKLSVNIASISLSSASCCIANTRTCLSKMQDRAVNAPLRILNEFFQNHFRRARAHALRLSES
jgi:hypothetical protein